MKILSIRTFRALIVAAALTLAALPAIHAQSTTPLSLVNVPFAFEVGSYHFAAGQYAISDMLQDRLLQVRGANDARLTRAMHEIASRPSANTRVVFHQYGDKYFLAQVWTANSPDYVQCIESGAEKQARKSQVALNSPQPNGIQVALINSIDPIK